MTLEKTIEQIVKTLKSGHKVQLEYHSKQNKLVVLQVNTKKILEVDKGEGC